jgi:hypothetical protein
MMPDSTGKKHFLRLRVQQIVAAKQEKCQARRAGDSNKAQRGAPQGEERWV